MRKIAQIVPTFYPIIGGMGKVCFEEAMRLVEMGNEVTVFTPRYKTKVGLEKINGFKVVRLRALFSFGSAACVPGLFLKLRKFDIIHLHYPFYGGMSMVYIACLLFRKRLVITYHMDAQPASILQRLLQKIYDWLFSGRLFKLANKVISVGDDFIVNRRYLDLIKNKKIEVNNGVDTVVFAKQEIELIELKKYQKQKVILFVGNLMRIKRLDLLIKSLPKLDDKKIVLLVVGRGTMMREYMELTAELEITARVKFMGATRNPKTLAQYYSVADLTVIPSEYESFSLVALEAMASYCPVVVSNIPGIRKRVNEGENGFLFEPGSVNDLAEKINKYFSLSDEKRIKMCSKARQCVEKKFSWDNHLDLLVEVYNNLKK